MEVHKKQGGILTEDTDDDYIYFPINSVTEGFMPSTSEEEIDESLISSIAPKKKKGRKKKRP